MIPIVVHMTQTKYFNIIIEGCHRKILGVNIFVLDDYITWFQSNTNLILRRLCELLSDNINTIESKYKRLKSGETSRINGNGVAAIFLFKQTSNPTTILVLDNSNSCDSYDVSSFQLDPLWLFPTTIENESSSNSVMKIYE